MAYSLFSTFYYPLKRAQAKSWDIPQGVGRKGNPDDQKAKSRRVSHGSWYFSNFCQEYRGEGNIVCGIHLIIFECGVPDMGDIKYKRRQDDSKWKANPISTEGIIWLKGEY